MVYDDSLLKYLTNKQFRNKLTVITSFLSYSDMASLFLKEAD